MEISVRQSLGRNKTSRLLLLHENKNYGLFIGISAAANVFASFQWLRDNNKTDAITILCDRGERYFSCL